MNDWLQAGGKKPTSAKAINALVTRFGGEVYDVLDLRPPAEPLDPDLRELHILMEMLKQIPPEKFKDLSLAIYAWARSEGIQIVDFKKES